MEEAPADRPAPGARRELVVRLAVAGVQAVALVGGAALPGLARRAAERLAARAAVSAPRPRRAPDRERDEHRVPDPDRDAGPAGGRPMTRKQSHAFAKGPLLYPVRATTRSGAEPRRCDIAGCERGSVVLLAEPNGSLLLVCQECARGLAARARR